MGEIHSAFAWEKGKLVLSPLTVTLQEVEVRGRHLLLAILCEGKGDAEKPQMAAGYLCESMVGWFYHEVIPLCRKEDGEMLEKLEERLRRQWNRASKEWQSYEKKKGQKSLVKVAGILLLEESFLAFGNGSVCVLNRRFNKPRLKRVIMDGEEVCVRHGEVKSLVRFLLGSETMMTAMEEKEIVECLFAEQCMEEQKLQKRLGELCRAASVKLPDHPVGGILLEVKP